MAMTNSDSAIAGKSKSLRLVVVGGGAAGFFGAIAAAEANPSATVTLLEKSPNVLSKVRISGGGRCNVTQSCFDPRELARRYPRGGRALIGPLTRFGPADTVEWFQSRGVRLKTEPDGRMFPVTNSSQTIIDCLTSAARKSGVHIFTERGISSITLQTDGSFLLSLTNGTEMECDRLLWAGGGCKEGNHPAVSLGHSLIPPVPSLFTFHVLESWVRELSGISQEFAQASVPGTDLKESGPILLTHAGLSGPAILRLSAWGARILHERNYQFPVRISWIPGESLESVMEEIQKRRELHGGQTVLRARWNPLPTRLWEGLVTQAGISAEMRWSKLPRPEALNLARLLTGTEFNVRGKSMNKEEFVTCGGIPLPEVDFKTM